MCYLTRNETGFICPSPEVLQHVSFLLIFGSSGLETPLLDSIKVLRNHSPKKVVHDLGVLIAGGVCLSGFQYLYSSRSS